MSLFATLLLLLVLPACGGGDGPGGSSGKGTSGTPPAGTAPPPGRYFPDGPWYQDVTNAPLDPRSREVVAWLDGQGWGTGTMRIDFSVEVLESDETTPFRARSTGPRTSSSPIATWPRSTPVTSG